MKLSYHSTLQKVLCAVLTGKVKSHVFSDHCDLEMGALIGFFDMLIDEIQSNLMAEMTNPAVMRSNVSCSSELQIYHVLMSKMA